MKYEELGNLNAEDAGEAKSSSSESELEREERAQFMTRLRSLIPARGENAFARRAGISASGLRGALNKGNPGRAMLIAIAREAGVSVDWLAAGEGPRERAQGALKPDKHGIPEPRLTAAQLAKLPTTLVESSDFRQMFLVAYAIKAVANDLSMSDQEELGRRMVGALVVASYPDGDTSHLDVTDMQALARVVRKLLPQSQ